MSTHVINFPGADINTTQLTVGTGGLDVDNGTLIVNTQTNRVGIGTTNPSYALDVVGGIRASGGLFVTYPGGVIKKTYSHSGTITGGTAPNIVIEFTTYTFSAKITAQLIESDNEISTLIIDVTGGQRVSGVSSLNIAKGPLSIFGDTTSNPWSSTVTTTPTTVTITPSTILNGTGYYNILIEYISGESAGSVTTIDGTSTEY